MIPRHIEVIYCDDIRYEIGNKVSFMGVYSADLFVSEFPAILPKLCIHVGVVTPFDEPFEKLLIQIHQNDTPIIDTGNIFAENLISSEPDNTSETSADDSNNHLRFKTHNFIFTLSPFAVEKNSKLRILAETEKGILRGRALLIRLAKEN